MACHLVFPIFVVSLSIVKGYTIRLAYEIFESTQAGAAATVRLAEGQPQIGLGVERERPRARVFALRGVLLPARAHRPNGGLAAHGVLRGGRPGLHLLWHGRWPQHQGVAQPPPAVVDKFL